jgi:uncharacterized protein (TIGR03790 family)
VKPAFLLLGAASALLAQDGGNVLLVVNDSSLLSRRIGEYYVRKRSIPLANVCRLQVDAAENVSREIYQKAIEAPIAACLASRQLRERILYIVTSLGLPLRIPGAGSASLAAEGASVDSELTLLYARMAGAKFKTAGAVPNPFFGKKIATFRHPDFPIYLVTRLAGYDFEDVKGIIDRSLEAENRGKFVIDLKANDNAAGDDWLRAAARSLPSGRVVLDESEKVLYDQRDVIGYAAWGSNDKNRKRRMLGFQWAPGAIVIEFVSTDGRTFERPPESWNIATWKDTRQFFAGSPQSLTADYIHEGATGCAGHVDEPFLQTIARPDLLFPAYLSGRNLAESYYVSMPVLSWQNIVVGDPLCKLRRAGN